MRHLSVFALGLLAMGLASGQSSPAMTTLFDGKTTNGWNAIGNANWSVANGIIEVPPGPGFGLELDWGLVEKYRIDR